jgi:hypothetical protein
VYPLGQAGNPPEMKFVNISGKAFNTIGPSDYVNRARRSRSLSQIRGGVGRALAGCRIGFKRLKRMPGQKARYFAHRPYIRKAATVRSTEGAAGLNTYTMSWFVPALVVPALLAALLLAWIAYQAYS